MQSIVLTLSACTTLNLLITNNLCLQIKVLLRPIPIWIQQFRLAVTGTRTVTASDETVV